MDMKFLQPVAEEEGEEGEGGSLKRSGVYLDFHVLSPSLCSWFGPAYKIGEKMP